MLDFELPPEGVCDKMHTLHVVVCQEVVVVVHLLGFFIIPTPL